MKQLTCEMCGSHDLLKHDGVFVCQTCGTKYSVEEAKKMMVVGTVEVKGTVKVDNSDSLINYLEMAELAYDSKNNTEAELYATKVIESDPKNYMAWLIKGQAAGWQSTLANIRFPESVSAFVKALSYAPADTREDVQKIIEKEIHGLLSSLVSLRAERFVKWPDAEETEGFQTDLTTIIKTIKSLHKGNVFVPVQETLTDLAKIINDAVIEAFNRTIYPEYKSREYPYPTGTDFTRYIDRIDNSIAVLNKAVALYAEGNEATIQIYQNMIDLENKAIEGCAYDWEYCSYLDNPAYVQQYRDNGFIVDVSKGRVYCVSKQLTDAAKATRKVHISTYEAKINAIKEGIEQKKIEEFWSRNVEYKAVLEEERSKVQEELATLKKSKKGHTRCESLEEYKEEIEEILYAVRKPNGQLTKKEKDFIKNRDKFWQKLSSVSEYDAYLDQYPILKKAQDQISKREELLKKEREIQTMKKDLAKRKRCKFFLAVLIILTVTSIILPGILQDAIGIFLLVDIVLVLAMMAVGFSMPLEISVEEILLEERKYFSELVEYNKTIDEMNAVPKFTGKIDSSKKVIIPEKIAATSDFTPPSSLKNAGVEPEEKIGTTIKFGKYNDGYGISDIEWNIIKVADGNALLLSTEVLDCKPYHSLGENVTWETCDLRKWLNNEFFHEAFSSAEQSLIKSVLVLADKNPLYANTNPGNATRDKIFLLSVKAATTLFKSDEERLCHSTYYATQKGVCVEDGGLAQWWLRNSGESQEVAAVVTCEGFVYDIGVNVEYDDVGVRPAMWIKLNK